MMPHDRCQHSQCWLKSFFTLSEVTPPLFHFYQQVEAMNVLEDDDGNDYTVIDRGVIVGIVYSSPDYPTEKWSYTIKYESVESIPHCPWLEFPFYDLLPESDLRAI